ncbi:MAG: hypothetical protein ABEJ72_05810 [Candidatus Aenigmatarchaeota archaeon]
MFGEIFDRMAASYISPGEFHYNEEEAVLEVDFNYGSGLWSEVRFAFENPVFGRLENLAEERDIYSPRKYLFRKWAKPLHKTAGALENTYDIDSMVFETDLGWSREVSENFADEFVMMALDYACDLYDIDPGWRDDIEDRLENA